MILSETLFLDNNCENCHSKEYMEHDSGFYVCINCAVVSNMRHGLALDYKDLNTKGMKYKRKNIEDPDDDDHHDFNNFDTNVNTHNNTCANSEFNDSYSSRLTRGEVEQKQKPLAEVLLENQKIFVKLFRSVFYFQFTKVIEEYRKKDGSKFSKNFNFEEFCEKINDKNISFFPINNNNENSYVENEENFTLKKFEEILKENYTQVFDLAKEKWMIFLKKEYESQTKKRGPKFRKRGLRSRRNTEDEFSHLNPMANNLKNENSNNKIREKKSINQELRLRRIKSKNINQVESYKNIRLKNKEKMKKFIEEYDQVLVNLKQSQDYIRHKTGIILNENLTFKNLLILANLFNIKINDDSSFEEIIHNFFTTKELNYISLYSEKTFDEEKSNFNSDNILIILYECFNSKINWFNKSHPFTIYDFISVFKSFKLKELQISELKFLKYISREKLFNSLKEIKISQSSYINIINHIAKMLIFPETFRIFCENLFIFLQEEIQNNLKEATYEAYSIGLIIFSIKCFYGLNDLPYMVDVVKVINQKNFLNENEKKIIKILKLFERNCQKDKLFKHFENMPSKLDLVENLVKLINFENKNCFNWDGLDYKNFTGEEYKNSYIDFVNKSLFPKLENNSCVRNISELEKKIGNFFDKESTNTDSDIDNDNDYDNIKELNNSFSVKFSANFTKKMNKKFDKKSEDVQLNKFLKEEVEYYKMIERKHPNKTNISIPLPCDSLLKYNKQAFKFDSIKPPAFELIIYYLFSKLFNIEAQTLRKVNKNLEKFVSNFDKN